MKDILKFTGTTLLMLVTLTLVGVVFIQSFMGDYEWLNMTLTAIYSLAVIAAAFWDGLQRGTQDCKFSALMNRQAQERGHEINQGERARMFRPQKGFLAGLLAASPAIVLSVLALIFQGPEHLWSTFVTRIALGAFLGVFQYVEALLPWLYLPVALLYPLCVGVGYLMGPKMWDRQVKLMEKAKKAKRRRVNRKKKAKKAV
jgi:hypothetical protein